jgi:uncharacterized membrane protein YbhN (UPF0104 family)
MVTTSAQSQYAMLWATIVLITVVSVLVYNAVSTIERSIGARFGIAVSR